MRVFKTFFSFSLPLIVMLLSYSIYIGLDNAIDQYKKSIINDYSIVIVSKKALLKSDIQNLKVDIKSLLLMPNKKIIHTLKQKLSKRSVELLNRKLPLFYKLYLNQFPTTKELREIKRKLLTITRISKVEIFSKNHDQVYSILTMTKNIIDILFISIILFSLIILSQHIKIWFYEYNERISIMRLHGASLIYCTMPLIKTAIYSSIFSSIIVISLAYYILTSNIFPIPIEFNTDFLYIIGLSISISIGTVTIVLLRHRFND